MLIPFHSLLVRVISGQPSCFTETPSSAIRGSPAQFPFARVSRDSRESAQARSRSLERRERLGQIGVREDIDVGRELAASLMLAAAIAEAGFGIDAEMRSLESIADPLSSE